MKKFIVLFVVLFLTLASSAWAGPFLRCDQYTVAMGDPDYFKITVDSAAAVQSTTYVYPNETGDAIHYDLTTLAVGQHTIKAQACKAATIWQAEVCSADSSPLVFTKPVLAVAPGVPVNLGLSAQ